MPRLSRRRFLQVTASGSLLVVTGCGDDGVAGAVAPPTFDLPAGMVAFPDDPDKEARLRARWNAQLDMWFERAIVNDAWRFTHQPRLSDFINPLRTPLPADAPTVAVTWTSFPNRVRTRYANVARRTQWAYADDGPPDADYSPTGPRGWQDEYAEWGVRRDAAGRITRLMFTAETREYYYALWAVDPEAVLAIYRDLIGPEVALDALYLRDADGAVVIDPQTGRPAYDDRNRHNSTTDGGVVHMIGAFNFLMGAIFLVGQSTVLRRTEDGSPISEPNQIVNCDLAATPYRNSDPFIGAVIGDLVRGPDGAGSGLRVAFADPPGLYIQLPNPDLFQLPPEAPDGARITDYWVIRRGEARQGGSGFDAILNLSLEVPPEHGFTVSDIRLAGQPIEYGAQLAEVMQVAVFARGVPQTAPPQGYPCSAEAPSAPYPEHLRERAALEVVRRSHYRMALAAGTAVDDITLVAHNADADTTVECVGEPGVTVDVIAAEPAPDDPAVLHLSVRVTAAVDAPPGPRALRLTDGHGRVGAARPAMLEVLDR